MGEGEKMGNTLGHCIKKTQTYTTPTFRNKHTYALEKYTPLYENA